MNRIDQHSILRSMEQALADPKLYVDGRTESDWLAFIANFAPLINFYDQHNRHRGNWEPFVLKDPVFLVASISKTGFNRDYQYFLESCKSLNYLLQPVQNLQAPPSDKTALSPSGNMQLPEGIVNNLFDLLIRVFQCIRRWVYYMQLSDETYPLKSFTLQKVKTVFAPYFWALISLRQNLFLSGYIKGVHQVDYSELYLFDAVDEITWKQNKEKRPYLEVLGLPDKTTLKGNSVEDIARAVSNTGNELFQFQQSIIKYAPAELELLKAKKTKFPDTILLRAFVDMLQVQQQQLNGLTAKHLRFCYRDILKLKERAAGPDSVFLCAELGKKDAVFPLPAGTLFNAGTDALNNPVTFAATEAISINPAAITGVYTIATLQDGNRFGLYKEVTMTPGILQRDEDGNIKTWKTFGGNTTNTATRQKQAIAFASPLLLLREGERLITVTLNFSGPVDPASLDDVQYSLSTQKKWLQTDKKAITLSWPGNQFNQAVITILLDATQPPIESFIKTPAMLDPDGLQSAWPLLKMEFASFSDPAQPPVIASLKIEVTVRGMKTVQVYNDSGALSTKAPFQIFGPVAQVNNSFIIGSDEIFSKPLNLLLMELDWDKLPPDFSAYYSVYNQYLAYLASKQTDDTKKENIFKRIFNWIGKQGKKIACLFNKKKCPDPVKECPPFCNTSFRVNFKILQQQSWTDAKISKAACFNTVNVPLTWNAYPASDPGCQCSDKYTVSEKEGEVAVNDGSVLLFSTDGTHCKTTPSGFSYTNPCTGIVNDKAAIPGYFVYSSTDAGTISFKPDPKLQQEPLLFTGASTSGFIKMSLTGPEYGFGTPLYPALITWIAFQNGWKLYNSKPGEDFFGFTEKGTEPAFIEAANLPFSPALSALVLHYTATEEYNFTTTHFTYPVQFFYYTPFQNYCIYDSVSPVASNLFTIDLTGEKSLSINTGIPLFQSVTNSGNLFLEIDQLLPTAEISLFFELASTFQKPNTATNAAFHYLSTDGWKTAPLLSDGTNNFTCSGIVKLNIPGDITNSSAIMPPGKYWLAITAGGNPVTYAQTAFLKTNGLLAQRTTDALYTTSVIPSLAAATITKPFSAIPQIAAMVQPFPSFGGKAQETETMMIQRAANRLATKDRASSPGDFFRMVGENFAGIFYTKTIFKKKNRTNTEDGIQVYVVKSVSGEKEAHAYLPLVNECTIEHIRQFLSARASAVTAITVSNFKMQFVQVVTRIEIKSGYEFMGVKKQVNKGLNLFLSPWITGSNSTLVIGQPLTETAVTTFISSIEGVAVVKEVYFATSESKDGNGLVPVIWYEQRNVKTFGDDYLLIPATAHNITEIA
jgi:hypothetical protein